MTASQQLIADGFEFVEPGWWWHPSFGAIRQGAARKWTGLPACVYYELGPFKTATEAALALKEYAEKAKGQP